MQTFDEQFERLKKASKTVTDTAFASFLGLKQGSISGAKNKGIVPPAWFFQVAEKTGLSVDWLFYGTGSMKKEKQCSEQGVVDLSILEKAIHVVEDGLSDGRQHIDAEKKATLIITVYNFLLDDTANDLQHIVRILKTIS